MIDGWSRERPDLDFSAMAAIMQAFGIHSAVHGRMTEELNPLGLGTNEAATLSILRSAGEPYRLTPTSLSKAIQCTTGGMTRLLDSVQGRAFVRRIPSPEDRRSLLVELTEEGVEMSDRVLELQAKVTGEVLAALTASETAQLEKLLGKLGLGP
jgi:DNA-binding MarR family transcriptional regulator